MDGRAAGRAVRGGRGGAWGKVKGFHTKCRARWNKNSNELCSDRDSRSACVQQALQPREQACLDIEKLKPFEVMFCDEKSYDIPQRGMDNRLHTIGSENGLLVEGRLHVQA